MSQALFATIQVNRFRGIARDGAVVKARLISTYFLFFLPSSSPKMTKETGLERAIPNQRNKKCRTVVLATISILSWKNYDHAICDSFLHVPLDG